MGAVNGTICKRNETCEGVKIFFKVILKKMRRPLYPYDSKSYNLAKIIIQRVLKEREGEE